MPTLLFLLISLSWAQSSTRDAYLRWASLLETEIHPESNYRYSAEIHKELAYTIKQTGNIVEPLRVGKLLKIEQYGVLK